MLRIKNFLSQLALGRFNLLVSDVSTFGHGMVNQTIASTNVCMHEKATIEISEISKICGAPGRIAALQGVKTTI